MKVRQFLNIAKTTLRVTNTKNRCDLEAWGVITGVKNNQFMNSFHVRKSHCAKEICGNLVKLGPLKRIVL